MKTIAIDARNITFGTGRYVERLLHYLQQIDHSNRYKVLLRPHDIDGWKPTNKNFEVVPCPHREFSFGEQLGFKRQLDGLGADLVHFGMIQQPALYRGKAVTTVMDLTTLRFINPTKNPAVFKFKQKVYARLVKRVVKKSAAVITISEYAKQDIVDFTRVNPQKITVTYPAADKIIEEAEHVEGLHKHKFIMYVGRPQSHKNLGRLMEAFVSISKSHPDMKLVLAGRKDGLFERHQRRAWKLGIADKVVFTGFVSEGQLRWLYENTACYVFPSLSEGFGLPGLEAMVHEAPVASSSATCLPEIYGDAAQYFDPLDVKDMAKTISEVLDNSKLADALRSKGQAHARKYSWKRMAEQTLEVYHQALNS